MTERLPLALIVIVLTFLAIASKAAQPNILIILADDMGYGDMGCMGSEHLATPHLDALAASGVLCSQAYAACQPGVFAVSRRTDHWPRSSAIRL